MARIAAQVARLEPGITLTGKVTAPTHGASWPFRLVRRLLPGRLRPFEQEIAELREDALNDAAGRPSSTGRWSETREVVSLAILIFKYRLFSVRVTTERQDRAE